MAPKKLKDATLEENYWRTSIEEAPLNEEIWSVKVILVEAAGSEQDRLYLNRFEIFAAEERRFVIKNICKTETIFMVNQLGGEKKVKDDNFRVFEEGQMFLKDKKDIPPEILALIIKYLILKMKNEYLFIKRQKLEVREGMKRESATMVSRAEVKGAVNQVHQTDETNQSALQKEKGKKDEPLQENVETSEGKKYNTLLRVRGEEWRDKIYVDDFPLDGPNLYVAITGFLEPLLAGCLVKIGVPLTAVIQIRIDPSFVKVPSSLFRTTKRGQSQTEIQTAKCQKFWEDLQELRIQRESCDDFKDTAFIVFSPPYWNTEGLSGQPDKIYDELCYLMYDVQDLTRQHKNYLENMDVICIPEDIEEDYYRKERKYYEKISELPLVCVTMYSVLDSILEAVCCTQVNQEDDSSKTSFSIALTLNQNQRSSKDENKVKKAENLVKDVFNSLINADARKQSYRITYGEEYESHMDPIVINYGDFVKYKTFQLGNINLDSIVRSMLYDTPIFKLWENQSRQSEELEAKINFHVNVLLSCFERKDIETNELNRLIHILACRKIYNNRSSLKVEHLPPSSISEFKKVFLKRSVLAEPLPAFSSFYRSWSSISAPIASKVENVSETYHQDGSSEGCMMKFLFDCPDISELVSAAEITSERPIGHLIDDFEFFEEFSDTSALQTMLNAFNTFNCVDYKYCEVTDCLILMFFNSHDKDGVAREEWRYHLPTPLCLQDFFDFVLEEQYDWIKKEEDIYTENTVQRSLSENKNSFDFLTRKTCIEKADIGGDLLMEGSLKYQELVKEGVASPEATETKTKNTSMSPSATDMASKSSKKTKSAVSTPKNIKQSFSESSTTSVNIPKKPFSGYNLSDRRVEIFGKDSCFFSKDGTKVLTNYKIMIPGNSEYIVLKVAPGNNNTEFWMHKALGDVDPTIIDTCESFRIRNKDDLTIYLKKQSFIVPSTIDISDTEKPSEKEKSTKSSIQNFNYFRNPTENTCFHSLNITWPTGLHIETVHESNSALISHVKQHYLAPLLNMDEDMRCISLNGDVIIFRPSGIIEILQPTGLYVIVNKCEKKNCPDFLEENQSDVSSDKSKKVKGKEKNKPSKASSKTSKNVINDDKISDIKLPEYELYIDEFEVTEANGLKQKWINDIPQGAKKLLIRTATDFCTGEVFSRRMDGTNTLINKDGVQIVTFPDNTRIITTLVIDEFEIYPEWTDEEIEYFAMFDSEMVESESMKCKSSTSQQSYKQTYRLSTSLPGSSDNKIDVDEKETKAKERTDGFISIRSVFTIEHKKFASISINKADNTISVTSPKGVTIVINLENSTYNFILDSRTTADFNGYDLNIYYQACLPCQSFTSCKIKIKYDEISSATNFHKWWLKMEDSFAKKIVVNDEGNIKVLDECFSDKETNEERAKKDQVTEEEGTNIAEKFKRKCGTGESENSLGKCRDLYEANAMRFFVLQRQLTCAELVHRGIVEKYKQNCRWQPWCSINQYDTFGDNRSILSILTPVYLTESEVNSTSLSRHHFRDTLQSVLDFRHKPELGFSPAVCEVYQEALAKAILTIVDQLVLLEKWLMESHYADKPKYLTYKDLKKDSGKGYYHWMRPYGRFQPKYTKPETLIPNRLPKAFILRNLEQQWSEAKRDKLKGSKELLTAILRYRHLIESNSDTILYVPIRDPRSPDERRIDDIIQAIAHRTYEDLKYRLAENVHSRAKPAITTKRPKVSEQLSLDGELEEISDEITVLEERRTSVVREVEAAADTSPNLKRYWRRRAEEYKEEQFYKYLLREGSVPPYFRNVLGGAIWWEINNVAEEATDKAERRKMKCACEEQPETSSQGNVVDLPSTQ